MPILIAPSAMASAAASVNICAASEISARLPAALVCIAHAMAVAVVPGLAPPSIGSAG